MTRANNYLAQLQKSPGHTLFHRNSWADYIELVCLASADNEVSQIDIIDRLSGRVRDLREGSTDELTELDDLETDNVDDAEPSRRAEVSDKWKAELPTIIKFYF